jgi:hypothetical protein
LKHTGVSVWVEDFARSKIADHPFTHHRRKFFEMNPSRLNSPRHAAHTCLGSSRFCNNQAKSPHKALRQANNVCPQQIKMCFFVPSCGFQKMHAERRLANVEHSADSGTVGWALAVLSVC